MAYCKRCGNEIEERATRCDECGEMVIDERSVLDDNPSVWHLFAGLCIPILGIILFIVWSKDRPKSARNALIGALISLPLIVIMGIVSAFVVPAVGTIIENTREEAVWADALAMEQAAELYCADTLCEVGDDLQYSDLSHYVNGLDEDYYDLDSSTDVVFIGADGMHVHLEAKGIGNLEFPEGFIPSQLTRDDIIIDTN